MYFLTTISILTKSKVVYFDKETQQEKLFDLNPINKLNLSIPIQTYFNQVVGNWIQTEHLHVKQICLS